MPCQRSPAHASSPALRGARVLPRADRASSRPCISLARCAAPLSLPIRARHALLPPPKTRLSSFAQRPGPTQTPPRSHRAAHSRGVPPHPPEAAAPNPASCSTHTAAPELWVPSFHRSPVADAFSSAHQTHRPNTRFNQTRCARWLTSTLGRTPRSSLALARLRSHLRPFFTVCRETRKHGARNRDTESACGVGAGSWHLANTAIASA